VEAQHAVKEPHVDYIRAAPDPRLGGQETPGGADEGQGERQKLATAM